MNKAIPVLGLLVLVAVAPATAGSLGAFGSWWSADDADDAPGAGILLDFRAAGRVDFQLRGTWYPEQETSILEGDDAGDLVEFSASTVDLGFAYNFTSEQRKFTPYVGAGGTLYLLDTDLDRQGRLDDEWGWYAVAGLDFPIGSHWVVFGEAFYRVVDARLKGNDLGFEPTVDQGITLSGPSVNVGLAWSW